MTTAGKAAVQVASGRRSEASGRRFPVGALPALAAVLPPLIWLAWAVIQARSHPDPTHLDRVALRLLGSSVLLSGLCTAICVLLGVPYGWLMARCRMPARRLLVALSLLPLLFPPYVAALAWIFFLGREAPFNRTLLRWHWLSHPFVPLRSLPMGAMILAFSYWPIVAWFTWFAARAVPLALEDSARLHLPEHPAARWAAGPALRRSVPGAALLVFLLAFAEFSVPNLLAVSVYPVEIVNRFQLDLHTGVVARLTGPLLLVILPLVLVQMRWLERAPVGAYASEVLPRIRLRFGGWPATVWCLLVLGITALLPLGVLIAYSLPLRTYGAVWAESSDHFLNSFITVGCSALLAAGLALLCGWATLGRSGALLDLPLTLPYALPASLIGVAMIQLLNRSGVVGWLYTSMAGLVWTYVALFFPFAHKSIQPAWGHVDRDLLDEGAVLGANGWTQFRSAAWPVLRPYVLAGGAMVGLLASREVDATSLIRIPGGDTIAFRIYDYLHYAPGPNVAALSVILIVLGGVCLGLLIAWAGYLEE